MAELRSTLAGLGYDAERLQAAFGSAVPPSRSAALQFVHATRREDALAWLARAFLAGLPIPAEAAARSWPESLFANILDAGLCVEEQGTLVPRALLVPVAGRLFASDTPRLLESSQASGFVPPAHTHAARYLLDLMIRRPAADVLDLGTGCGVHAVAATDFAERVVATDVNPRARAFAQFNAALNDLDAIECLTGDLYEPVNGREFDLILSNPPFVPGPARQYTYRDAGEELDAVTQRVLRGGAVHLKPGGHLELLCEWVEIEGEPWQQRLAGWMTGLGCDAWVLRSPPQEPATYAAIRLSELDTPQASQDRGRAYAEWLDYFSAHRVKAIHPGVIVLRRRRGRNWMQVHAIQREVRTGAGGAILENLRACDFLAAHTRAESLLDQVLAPASDLAIEQSHRRAGDRWEVAGIRAWLTGGLPLDVELDPASAMLLREFDGRSTVAECLERFANAIGEDFPEVRRRCQPALRLFLERGMLRPPAVARL